MSRLVLVLVPGDGEKRVRARPVRPDVPWELDRRRVTYVGRDDDNDIVIDHDDVARHHCCFVPSRAGVTVFESGSTHGTFVNDRRIESQLLAPGDSVRIARAFVLEVRASDDDPFHRAHALGRFVIFGLDRAAGPGWWRGVARGEPRVCDVHVRDDRQAHRAVLALAPVAHPALPRVIDDGQRGDLYLVVTEPVLGVPLVALSEAIEHEQAALDVRIALHVVRSIAGAIDAALAVADPPSFDARDVVLTWSGRVIFTAHHTTRGPTSLATAVESLGVVLARALGSRGTDLPDDDMRGAVLALLSSCTTAHEDDRYRAPSAVVEAIDAMTRDTDPVSDGEIAALVCGLFPDEAATAALLCEQVGVLDEAGLAALTARP